MPHRSRATQEAVWRHRRWLMVETFPAHAPELNPVEYFWAHVAGTDLANFSADHLGQVRRQVWKPASRVRRRDELGRAFLRHAGFF